MSKNTGTSELINYFDLGVNGDVGIAGSLDINTIANATTDTDKFLVSDSGVIKYRTGAELLSDIGGQSLLTNPVTGTGTTNYLPKFTGSTTIGNSQVFDNGTNIGLFTNDPFYELHILKSGVNVEVVTESQDSNRYATNNVLTDVSGASIASFASAYPESGGSRWAGRSGLYINTGRPNQTFNVWIGTRTVINSLNDGKTAIGQSDPLAWLDVQGDLMVRTVANSTGDFLTISGGNVVSRRTAAQVLSDIGAASSSSIANYLPLAGGTMTGNITFNGVSGRGLFWGMNTDGALIRFISTGDSAGQSYLEIGTTDNSDEPIIFTQTGLTRVQIATDGLLKNGSSQNYLFENGGTWGIGITGNAGTVTNGVYTSRTITINGTTQDLSANRTYNVGTVTSVTASSPLASSGGTTPNITIQQASGSQNGFLSSTDWTTFNNKQNALTNPVTGTGTTNYLPKFTGASTIGNSIVSESGSNISVAGSLISGGSNKFVKIGNTAGIFTNSTYFNDLISLDATVLLSREDGLYTGAIFTYESASADNVGIVSNGSIRMVVNGTANRGLILDRSGNLLVGTTSDAGYKLDVNGTGRFSGNVVLGTTALTGGGAAQWLTANGTAYGGGLISSVSGVVKAYYYYDNGANAAMVQGTFGVGVQLWANNTVALSIASTGAATFSSSVTAATDVILNNGTLFVSAGSGTSYAGRLSTAYIFPYITTYLDSFAGAGWEGRLQFRTNSAGGAMNTQMTILNNGNVLIGTSSATPHNGSNALIIQGGGGGRSIMELHESSGAGGKAVFQQVGGDTYLGSLGKGSGSGDLYLLVNGTGTSASVSTLFKANGNVLIGTTTDVGAKLYVNGAIRTEPIGSGGVTGNWKFGNEVSGTISENTSILVEIDGREFRINAREV
jgi:hypothetical protein